MGFSGRLEGIAPSDIFQIISQNKMTGTLIARCSDRTAMVVFSGGQVIEAASDAPKESLGHVLVSRGLVSEDEIEVARKRWKLEPEQTLGSLLMHMGAIDGKTLEAEVRMQIGNIVQRLMSCEDGFITFDRGETAIRRKLHTREFLLPAGLSAEYLIMERARVLDEERRSGQDRRAQNSIQAPEGVWDGVERRRAIMAAAPVTGIGPNLRGLGRALVASLKSAAGVIAGKTKELSENASRLFRAFPSGGRAMIVAGSAALAAAIVLFLTVVPSRVSQSELVITGRIVNVRSAPSTASKTIVKVKQGEVLSPLSMKEGWHQVRTQAGTTGWVWNKLVQQKEIRNAANVPGKIVSGVLFAAGAALLGIGILRKRRTAATAKQ
ncbi:MAG TPA: DUF4388 domain-containing protein [Nitrospirota bacterium]|nr:DUF4388 domain-containing protein [Nitrospirota bacterium]